MSEEEYQAAKVKKLMPYSVLLLIHLLGKARTLLAK
jgi:hypothetical protein